VTLPAAGRDSCGFRAFGDLTVTTSCPGHDIWINGASTQQVTPHTFSLVFGDYTVSIQDCAVTPASRSVTVPPCAGVSADFTCQASLTVASTPSGASITLDGAPTGEITPHTFTVTPGTPHTASVSRTGCTYNPASCPVTLAECGSQTCFFVGAQGSLTVDSHPQGAAINLDATPTGEVTPHTFVVSVGNHSVTLGDLPPCSFASRTCNASVPPCGSQTCTLTATCTANLAPLCDTYISADEPSVAHDAAAVLAVGEDSQGQHAEWAGLQFDLSTIPPSATIQSAHLILQQSACGSGNTDALAIMAAPISGSWTCPAATWDASPFSAGVAGNVTRNASCPGAATLDFDVKTIVAGWWGGSIANNGLVLRPAAAPVGVSHHFFGSSEEPVSTQRPLLQVTYTVP
jgi:hypothetical protein